jgi:hypothetical protein
MRFNKGIIVTRLRSSTPEAVETAVKPRSKLRPGIEIASTGQIA